MSSCPGDAPVPNNELGRFGVEMVQVMHQSMTTLSQEIAELKMTVKLSAELQYQIAEKMATRTRELADLKAVVLDLRGKVDAIRDTVASIPDRSMG